MKTYDEKRKAVRISAYYKDFDGNLDKWKNAFYQLWRWQMTWDFAYEIQLIDTRDGVKVYIMSKPNFQKNVLETMQDLGYRDIQTWEEKVAVFYTLEHEDLEEMDFITAE